MIRRKQNTSQTVRKLLFCIHRTCR